MSVLLITQARRNSTRLPEKILKEVAGNTLLSIHMERLKACQEVDHLMLATTTNSDDELIYDIALAAGFNSYRGSEEDVLDRFYHSAQSFDPKWVVRVTSDCPLIDPKLVDQVITYAKAKDVDYVSNVLVEHFPDGQDIEVMKWSALQQSWKEAELASDREHVTMFIRRNADFNGGELFKALNFPCDVNLGHIRLTVDEQKDLEVIKELIERLGTEAPWRVYADAYAELSLGDINGKIIRNEGYLKSREKDG